jgi:hypothetical protein
MTQDNEIDWFEAGYTVGKGGSDDALYPPMDDMEAQRAWLGGFGAGWAEGPDKKAPASNLADDGDASDSVDQALTHAMRERADLLRQLRTHGEGRTSRAVH